MSDIVQFCLWFILGIACRRRCSTSRYYSAHSYLRVTCTFGAVKQGQSPYQLRVLAHDTSTRLEVRHIVRASDWANCDEFHARSVDAAIKSGLEKELSACLTGKKTHHKRVPQTIWSIPFLLLFPCLVWATLEPSASPPLERGDPFPFLLLSVSLPPSFSVSSGCVVFARSLSYLPFPAQSLAVVTTRLSHQAASPHRRTSSIIIQSEGCAYHYQILFFVFFAFGFSSFVTTTRFLGY